MARIMRIDEYGDGFRPCTYILSNGSSDIDEVWEVAVYVKDSDELQSLVDLEFEYGFQKTEYASGKHEIEAFGKTLTLPMFKRKLGDGSLHAYTMKAPVGDMYANHIYYSRHLGKDMIELSSDRLLNRLKYAFDQRRWDELCKQPHRELEKKYGTYIYTLGRNERHVCVENTLENRMRFPEMLDDVRKAQDEIVDRYNS